MEWFNQLINKDPIIAIIAMLVFGLGGLIHIAILLVNRFGFLGKKNPSINDVLGEIKMIQGNHLHELPEIAENQRETLKAINRQEQMLQKINDTLIEIKAKL